MTSLESKSGDNISQRTPEQTRQEIARSVVFFGFEGIISANTPLESLRSRQNTLHADLPVEHGGKAQRVTLELYSVVYDPSCWGPDTSPLEIRVYLGDNPEFFALRPFGKASVNVRRTTGIFSSIERAREFTDKDQEKLKGLLVKMQDPDTKFEHLENH